ncbi:hypothetical protein NEOKW01_0387 [Nematocida sp. AWRm80]|nr:hypothetical protein NEOKW01_0387 [Nematocida sp. AWRm80]
MDSTNTDQITDNKTNNNIMSRRSSRLKRAKKDNSKIGLFKSTSLYIKWLTLKYIDSTKKNKLSNALNALKLNILIYGANNELFDLECSPELCNAQKWIQMQLPDILEAIDPQKIAKLEKEELGALSIKDRNSIISNNIVNYISLVLITEFNKSADQYINLVNSQNAEASKPDGTNDPNILVNSDKSKESIEDITPSSELAKLQHAYKDTITNYIKSIASKVRENEYNFNNTKNISKTIEYYNMNIDNMTKDVFGSQCMLANKLPMINTNTKSLDPAIYKDPLISGSTELNSLLNKDSQQNIDIDDTLPQKIVIGNQGESSLQYTTPTSSRTINAKLPKKISKRTREKDRRRTANLTELRNFLTELDSSIQSPLTDLTEDLTDANLEKIEQKDISEQQNLENDQNIEDTHKTTLYTSKLSLSSSTSSSTELEKDNTSSNTASVLTNSMSNDIDKQTMSSSHTTVSDSSTKEIATPVDDYAYTLENTFLIDYNELIEQDPIPPVRLIIEMYNQQQLENANIPQGLSNTIHNNIHTNPQANNQDSKNDDDDVISEKVYKTPLQVIEGSPEKVNSKANETSPPSHTNDKKVILDDDPNNMHQLEKQQYQADTIPRSARKSNSRIQYLILTLILVVFIVILFVIFGFKPSIIHIV